MGRPTIEEDKCWFLSKLKEEGGVMGNTRLMTKLSWSEERYWRTHTDLVDDGVIIRGRGRGGSVILVEKVLPPVEDTVPFADEIPSLVIGSAQLDRIAPESSLYGPAQSVISKSWIRERAFDDSVVEITATRGNASAGIWTRPDLTVVASKSYQYLPGRSFEIITFEIKRIDSIDVRGVFEALSHRRFATMSYVLFFTGGKTVDDLGISYSRIRDISRDHGVGVIAASNINDYDTWEELVEARRNTYDPEEANLFISSSLSEDTKSKIIKWHK